MPDKIPELFVYKQSYKARNIPSTAVLNQKHLIYIATRPGVMCNPECGFGLWGKLPGMVSSQNINDLRLARKEIGAASADHTLYRAVLSVDKQTAQQYDLYNRETWQSLINTKISVIQREMRIKPDNFRWVASMHYKKRHPHVHIIFWDAGKEPRTEYIPKERFEEMSERIRTTFSRAVYYAEELKAAQGEQTDAAAAARLQLKALLKEANLTDALNLDHVKQCQLDDLGHRLAELARKLPATGRLKYKLLPEVYKAELNAYLGLVMKLPDFAKLEQKYTSLAEEVSRMYGNDAGQSEVFQEKAHVKLYTDLGNEVLKSLKEYAMQLEGQEPPQTIHELCRVTQFTAQQILRDNPGFRQLLSLLPKERTPTSELMKDRAIKKLVDQLTQELAKDIRVRSKAEGYAKAASTDDKASAKERKDSAYHTLYQAMNAVIVNTMRKEMGYERQQNRDMAMMSLLRLFRSGSQSKNQAQSQRDLQREKYRNLSETAKRDLRKKRQQEGNWSMEF